jgi:hypothetical protein
MDDDWLTGRAEPLSGTVRKGDDASWVTAALQSRDAFHTGLRDVGLPDSEVARMLALRDDTETQLRAVDAEIRRYRPPDRHFAFDPVPPNLYLKRASLWRRFADSFAGREFRVLEATVAEVRVPLFILSCPGVDGCTAAFDREEMHGRTLDWGLTVFGSGVSGSRPVSASASATFTATTGQTKVVFVPLRIELQRVAVLESGRQIGTGFQLDGSSVRTDSAPGLLLLDPEARPPAGAPVDRFPLAGDPSGDLQTYRYKHTRATTVQVEVGLEAFHTKASLKVGTERSTQIALEYGLRSGYDYVLLEAADSDGLLWACPGTDGDAE